MNGHVVPYELRERLYEALHRSVRQAADFTCSAGNFDRPIAELPEHLQRAAMLSTPGSKYDARWYAAHDVVTGAHSRLYGAVDDILAEIERAAYALGALQSVPGEQ